MHCIDVWENGHRDARGDTSPSLWVAAKAESSNQVHTTVLISREEAAEGPSLVRRWWVLSGAWGGLLPWAPGISYWWWWWWWWWLWWSECEWILDAEDDHDGGKGDRNTKRWADDDYALDIGANIKTLRPHGIHNIQLIYQDICQWEDRGQKDVQKSSIPKSAIRLFPSSTFGQLCRDWWKN